MRRRLIPSSLCDTSESTPCNKPTASCLSGKILVLKGPKLIAVGERLCAKPTVRCDTTSDPERVKLRSLSGFHGPNHQILNGFAQSRRLRLFNFFPQDEVLVATYTALRDLWIVCSVRQATIHEFTRNNTKGLIPWLPQEWGNPCSHVHQVYRKSFDPGHSKAHFA